ncbi:hypothetical protein BD311DRAFT_142823 [Dichomitus squalens]|uniref:Uncharacterized protein n=1 Tax=Dichomitus squalens TaxID=114155 RepID=A0A4Q9M9B3_9APHY|nr:hypothetical protein BD311DRAFT_142823 [Dichomitus squalens]
MLISKGEFGRVLQKNGSKSGTTHMAYTNASVQGHLCKCVHDLIAPTPRRSPAVSPHTDPPIVCDDVLASDGLYAHSAVLEDSILLHQREMHLHVPADVDGPPSSLDGRCRTSTPAIEEVINLIRTSRTLFAPRGTSRLQRMANCTPLAFPTRTTRLCSWPSTPTNIWLHRSMPPCGASDGNWTLSLMSPSWDRRPRST